MWIDDRRARRLITAAILAGVAGGYELLLMLEFAVGIRSVPAFTLGLVFVAIGVGAVVYAIQDSEREAPDFYAPPETDDERDSDWGPWD